MRYRGAKLPRETVKLASPVRGVLQLSASRPGHYAGQRNAPVLAGIVAPGRTEWAIPPLDHARVVRIAGPNMIIVGTEEIVAGRKVETFPQAWWVRVVLDGDDPTAARPRPRPAPAPEPVLVR